jgi:hypothetical protein
MDRTGYVILMIVSLVALAFVVYYLATRVAINRDARHRGERHATEQQSE